ncbi:MAG TPA: FHA domain-containing protein [Acidimicrobiales bacterium]|nr:FHA domain-containing protein [Acidimicrobiales bacterium]
MSHGLLDILKYFLLALLWLFFLYAARMVLVDVRRSRRSDAGARAAASGRRVERDLATHVRVLEPPERRGQTYELADELTIGRSAGCVIALEDDNFASLVHARIFNRSGEVWVEDLGSTNGTYVNNERLTAPARLRRSDRVKVGGTLLEVRR